MRAISRPCSVTSIVSPCLTRASTSLVWWRRSLRPTACASAVTQSMYHNFVDTSISGITPRTRPVEASSLLASHTLDRAASGDHANRAGHAGPVIGAVAVRVLGVAQVLLVVVLGEVELARGHDLGGDVSVAGLRQPLLVAGPRLLRLGLLLRRLVEDGRPVLAANVITLAHSLRRVV